jgi:hypothetical protein
MAPDIDLAAWDSVLLSALANEPAGVLEQHMAVALPQDVATRWLPDAERRGLVERVDKDRWRLTERGRGMCSPSQSSIVVGLPVDEQ